MDPFPERFVWRYLAQADRFVRVRVVAPGCVPVEPGPELSAASYQRSLVEACILFDADAEGESGLVEPRLARLHPEGLEAAIEALFAQVVAVNPALDLARVTLHERPGTPGSTPDARELLGLDALDKAEPRAARRRSREEQQKHLARRARGLRARLARRIVGQPAAVASTTAAVERAAAGLFEPRGPLGTLLFVGRTGTGKTELARALAEELAPKARARGGGFVRIDCSEYVEEHQQSRLIGAPPGYVGFEEGGQLSDALAREPEAVVLFDEVEKAHASLHNLLLQVLDEGRLTDGRGERVDLTRAFVILTSNAGGGALANAAEGVGFARGRRLSSEETHGIARAALGERFLPELLARLDEVVVFRDLDTRDVTRIAEEAVKALAVRARRRGLKVEFTPAVARWIARESLREGQGARGVAHLVRRTLEAPLAAALLAGPRGARITVGLRAGRPRLRRERA